MDKSNLEKDKKLFQISAAVGNRKRIQTKSSVVIHFNPAKKIWIS